MYMPSLVSLLFYYFCLLGRYVGWGALLTCFSVDGYGSQVPHQGLSYSDALLWNCEYCGEWSCYAQVRVLLIWFGFSVKTYFRTNSYSRSSSIVLWVSQNIEDDYTYNLAL